MSWVAERCVTGDFQWGVGQLLWSDYRAWVERNNERPGTRKSFADAMKARGFLPQKSQGVRGYGGINLSAQATAAEPIEFR